MRGFGKRLLGMAVILSGFFFHAGPASATTFIRKDVKGLTATDPIMVDYAKAVSAMQTLPSTNPLSWQYQAAIHGTQMSGNQPGWNSCEHSSPNFWPWHRMYLYWFERIVRKMSGDPNFTLPYWNWNDPAERALPPMFLDSTSVLWVAGRNLQSSSDILGATTVDYSGAFSQTNFDTTDMMFENQPHGQVHIRVGGPMHQVATAALDPIFYLHHCNVDRLWDMWLAQGGRMDPVMNLNWGNKKSVFFDENGHPVTMTACQVLMAANQLNYKYDTEPAQVAQSCPASFVHGPIYVLTPVIRIPAPPDATLGNTTSQLLADAQAFSSNLKAMKLEEAKPRYYLVMDGVEAATAPGIAWDIYLGAKPENLKTGVKSPNYLGSVALFGSGIRDEARGGVFHPARFVLALKPNQVKWLEEGKGTVPLVIIPDDFKGGKTKGRVKLLAKVKVSKISFSVGVTVGK